MKIKFLRTVGTQDASARSEKNPNSPQLPRKADGSCYQENEVADLKEEEATKFIEAGLAVAAPAEPKPEKPAPPKAEDKK